MELGRWLSSAGTGRSSGVLGSIARAHMAAHHTYISSSRRPAPSSGSTCTCGQNTHGRKSSNLLFKISIIKLKHEADAPAKNALPHSPWPQRLRKNELEYGMKAIPVDWTLVAWKGRGCCLDVWTLTASISERDWLDVLEFNQISLQLFQKARGYEWRQWG